VGIGTETIGAKGSTIPVKSTVVKPDIAITLNFILFYFLENRELAY
jgi:hypothetical protein